MANGDNVNIWGQASRGAPGAIPDNSIGPVRITRRGELVTMPLGKWRYASADEGSYFVAHNPQNDPGVTLAGHFSPLLTDVDTSITKPFLHLMMDPAAGEQRAYLDFIEIEVVTAGTNATQAGWAAQLDSGTSRAGPGGTAFTRTNPNLRSTETPSLAVQGGAIVATPETPQARSLGFGTLRRSVEVAGDVKLFVFGGDPENAGAVAGPVAAATRTSVVCLPPVVLGPTDQFLLALHGQASQNAAGIYKVRVAWMER